MTRPPRRRTLYFSSCLLLPLATAMLACRPRALSGAPCRAGDGLVCTASDRALVCDHSAWRELPCRGRRGCTHGAGEGDCDDALAVAGDACPRNPAIDYACSIDHTAALECREGRFALWRHCRGQGGCRLVGDRRLDCDTTLGEIADPCDKEDTYSCSTDRKTMLECDGRSLVPASSCRGPEGCRVDPASRKVDCSDGVAVEGDPCDEERRITCDAAGRAELSCDGKRYVRKRECRHRGCRVEGAALYCD